MSKEEDIEKKIKQITECERINDYSGVREHLSRKRLNWLKENYEKLELTGTDVKKAYNLILIHYMGINPTEVEIIEETPTKITWKSGNWCPVLEACKRTGTDTRKACKEGWHESVDQMVKFVNPKLEFSRDYQNLRPHGQYYIETIELKE